MLAIWLGILFHASMTIFTGMVLFLYVAPAAYLAFARATTEVIYDGDCGICAKTKRWFETLVEGAFWTTYQSGIGDRFGISRDAVANRLHIVTGGDRSGLPRFMLYNPVTHFHGVLLMHWGPAFTRSVAITGLRSVPLRSTPRRICA